MDSTIIPMADDGLCRAALVLLLHLVAMQFTSEVNWTVGDFVFPGVIFPLVRWHSRAGGVEALPRHLAGG
jgi:hypothetical protein